MAMKKKGESKSAKPKAKKPLKDLDASAGKDVKGGAQKRARRVTDDTSVGLARRR
jgi:hypothetical protein